MKWRDVLGLMFLIFGVAGCMTGIRGFTGDAWWGGPAIGAGVVVNALAYRTMRSTTRATPKTKKEEQVQEVAEPITTTITTEVEEREPEG